MKGLIWQGSSYEDLKVFPTKARSDAGYQLDKVQRGHEPSDWKTMVSVGSGIREIRIHCGDGAFRVVYVTNIGDSIYVLHAFQKKTQKTSAKDIQLIKVRFKSIER